LVVDMSKSLVGQRDISHIMKQRNSFNVSIIRTMSNARKKLKVVEYAGKLQIQQLMNKFSEYAYIEVHRSCLDTDTVKDIF